MNDAVTAAMVTWIATKPFHGFEEFNTVINTAGIDNSELTDRENLS